MSGTAVNFIDFGAGRGTSFDAATTFANAEGMAIDKSADAVAACLGKGIVAEQIDVLDFDQRNVVGGSFAFNLLQELPGRAEFTRALINMTRAARDYVLIQHPYYDQDSELSLKCLHVEDHFSKKVLFRPTIADYLNFVATHQDGLSICGVSIHISGTVQAVPFILEGANFRAPAEPVDVPKSIRIVFGRKSLARFRPVLDKAKMGKHVFLWEKA